MTEIKLVSEFDFWHGQYWVIFSGSFVNPKAISPEGSRFFRTTRTSMKIDEKRVAVMPEILFGSAIRTADCRDKMNEIEFQINVATNGDQYD